MEYTPDTNNVITVTGNSSAGLVPVSVMQEITGTTSNTISSVYNPITSNNSTNEYKLASLAQVIGGSEVPQALTVGSNAPVVIRRMMYGRLRVPVLLIQTGML